MLKRWHTACCCPPVQSSISRSPCIKVTKLHHTGCGTYVPEQQYSTEKLSLSPAESKQTPDQCQRARTSLEDLQSFLLSSGRKALQAIATAVVFETTTAAKPAGMNEDRPHQRNYKSTGLQKAFPLKQLEHGVLTQHMSARRRYVVRRSVHQGGLLDLKQCLSRNNNGKAKKAQQQIRDRPVHY